MTSLERDDEAVREGEEIMNFVVKEGERGVRKPDKREKEIVTERREIDKRTLGSTLL